MSIFKKYFSETPCNTGRQTELDIGKALPILCLASIHCIIECTSDEGLASGIPYLFDTIIGGPLSAPMYMFAMGAGMVYTKHRNASDLAKRGIGLIVLSYVLNICRFLIPYLFGYAVTGDSEQYLDNLKYIVPENDVLFFAGAAFLAVSVFVRFRISHFIMLAFAGALSVFGTFMNGVDVDSIPGNILLGYLVGTEDPAELVHSYFPFCNWFIIPAAGYFFGYYLQRVKNRNKLYTVLLVSALPLAIAYFCYGIYSGNGMFGDGQNCYYHMIFPDSIGSLLAAMGFLGLYNKICKFLPIGLTIFLWSVSKNITVIYFTHWIFVIWITNVVVYIINGTQELPVWLTLFISVCITTISVIIAQIYRRIENEKKKKVNE